MRETTKILNNHEIVVAKLPAPITEKHATLVYI